MKIGDKVRFLSETGGGTVAGFQGKNIVLVEDEDGFQIPTAVTDVVVIGNEDYSTAHVAKAALDRQNQPAATADGRSIKAMMAVGDVGDEPDDDPSERPVTFRAPAEERKGGNQLSCYLAFVPIDPKELTQTRFECYFVNDCNYHIHYTYLAAEGNSWTLRATGEVEPNTKEFVEEFGRDALNDMTHVAIQLTAYKREKPFILKPTVDVQLRIDPVKFYKLHTFGESDFFEQPALLYTIVENDRVARPLVVDAKTLKQEIYAKGQPAPAPHASRPSPQAPRPAKGSDLVVVDLHAHELLETTAGMSNADILNYQVETFRKTLEQYQARKGQKIVFIHGKGEGVLRQALIHELNYRYKRYTYQDASFREYGYGATQVTIR